MRERIGGRAYVPPAAGERVWRWFWQLDRTRNGYAANRIGFPDIRALAGNVIDQWEEDAILAMDVILLAGIEVGVEPEPSGPPMTLSMFKEWVS